jgi:Ca2+-transporting ATPase
MNTEVGRIASMLLNQERIDTPLQRKMGEISKSLSFLCLGVCAVMFGVGLLQGKELLSMLLIAVSLAVAAIPEGLPAIVTIVLALGVQRMAEQHAIVKKLPAVETLGCASVICSDKTGTLTRNKMTVERLWTLSGEARPLAWGIGCLCSDVGEGKNGTLTGDPTETAIVEGANVEGISKFELDKKYPRLGELPFDADRKLMSTLHPSPNGGVRIMVKGGPDVLLQRCRWVQRTGKNTLTAEIQKEILSANDAMAEQALRVLGVAYRELPALPEKMTSQWVERDLVFVGLIGMIDP